MLLLCVKGTDTKVLAFLMRDLRGLFTWQPAKPEFSATSLRAFASRGHDSGVSSRCFSTSVWSKSKGIVQARICVESHSATTEVVAILYCSLLLPMPFWDCDTSE